MANRLDALSEQLSDVNPYNNNNNAFAVPAIQSAQDLHLFNQFLEQLSASCGTPIDSTLSDVNSLANAVVLNPLDGLTTTTATTAANANGSLDLLNVALDPSTNDVVYPDLSTILSNLATKPLAPPELVPSSLLTNPLGSSIASSDHEQSLYPDLHSTLTTTTTTTAVTTPIDDSPYPDLTQVLPLALQQHTLNMVAADGGSDRVQEARRVPNHVADRDALLRQVVLLSSLQTCGLGDGATSSKSESVEANDGDIDIEQLSKKLAGLGLQQKSPTSAEKQGPHDGDTNDDDDNRPAKNGCGDSCNARQKHAKLIHMLYVKVNQTFRCRPAGQAFASSVSA